MAKYICEGKTVNARNYTEAAEKLFGQTYYKNPGCCGTIPTTYVWRHNGYAEVKVFKVGDKQGSYWGVQAAVPKTYEIKRA
ncbi:MAG: hypothetical protein HFI82_13445 [Eubacterium sp.]|jgi:hypothetical protein|nr:hypothetical protein [Eubacterium sp.]